MPIPKIIIFTALQSEAKAVGTVAKGKATQLYTIGIGAGALPRDLPPARCIIMAGLAGALDPSLRIGDVILDSDSPLGSLRRGKLHTTEQPVLTPGDKARLFGETGASAVEMENATVRDLASSLAVPFIGIRAISDTAQDAIDPDILRWIDKTGSPRIGRIAASLIARPGLLRDARRLARDSKLALRSLGLAVAEVVRELDASRP